MSHGFPPIGEGEPRTGYFPPRGYVIGIMLAVIDRHLAGCMARVTRLRVLRTMTLIGVSSLVAFPLFPAVAHAVGLAVSVPHPSVPGTVRIEQASTLADLADWGQFVAGLAALVGFPFIAYQVYAARTNAARDRTATLHFQWGSREFWEERSPVVAYLDVRGDAGNCVRKLRAWLQMAHAEDRRLPRPSWNFGDGGPGVIVTQ